jgi:hypothetical protein
MNETVVSEIAYQRLRKIQIYVQLKAKECSEKSVLKVFENINNSESALLCLSITIVHNHPQGKN